MGFTSAGVMDTAPTLRDWIGTPKVGYHQMSGVSFAPYSPVMPMPLPPYGGPHPQAKVNKLAELPAQNMYALYANPQSMYFQNSIGQR